MIVAIIKQQYIGTYIVIIAGSFGKNPSNEIDCLAIIKIIQFFARQCHIQTKLVKIIYKNK